MPYRRLFRLMIEDWRAGWGQGSLPFLFVQLANFKANPYWPLLRESQVDALELRDTAMAVAIDVGESNDIHPKNKQAIGHRLALAARATVYGERLNILVLCIVKALLKAMPCEFGSTMWVLGSAFRGTRSCKGFLVAGKDEKFVLATARIEGNTVVISSTEVPEPTAVRCAWADDATANLMNRDGLPAGPFRSDRWVIAAK